MSQEIKFHNFSTNQLVGASARERRIQTPPQLACLIIVPAPTILKPALVRRNIATFHAQ